MEPIVEAIVVGPLETNCYIVGCPETHAGIVVDAGGDGEYIAERVRGLKLNPAYIVATHGHGDHIGGVPLVKAAFPAAKLAVHEADAESLPDPDLNLSSAYGMPVRSPAADVRLRNGDEVVAGTLRFRVIHVPGHTPGGIALYLPPEKGRHPLLLAGDALFQENIGRGDLPGGDLDLLIRSVRERLMTLPDDTKVLTGHGGPTTIGHEKRHNPYVSGR